MVAFSWSGGVSTNSDSPFPSAKLEVDNLISVHYLTIIVYFLSFRTIYCTLLQKVCNFCVSLRPITNIYNIQ